MDNSQERLLAVNGWIIRARWFYVGGILLIGFLTRLSAHTNQDFPRTLMLGLAIFVLTANLFLGTALKRLKKDPRPARVNLLNYSQVGLELLVLSVIFHFSGGVDGYGYIYFFLPIVSSSLLLGPKGAFLVSFLSAASVSGIAFFEYAGLLKHIARYKLPTIEYLEPAAGMIKTATISIFYFIISIFAGMSARLLVMREEQSERKSSELLALNRAMDKKLKELEKAQQSVLNAFRDLKQEQLIADSERRRTRAILSHLVDPVILIDQGGLVNFLNPAARRAFSPDGAVLGQAVRPDNGYSMRNFQTLFSVPYEVRQPLTGVGKEGNVEEVVIRQEDTETAYKVLTVSVNDDEGKGLGTMKIFTNLTREKMIEKLKSEFISIAAHQLRTPLSAVKWAIRMVLDGDVGRLSDDQIKILSKGYESNERIIRLVNDMLDVSRIEDGRFNYEFGLSDIKEILNKVLADLDGRIKAKKLEISVGQNKEAPPFFVDKEKMRMVFYNLLENAVEYSSDRGRIDVTIEVGRDLCRFYIKDHGVGIPDSEQHRVFSKFYRGANVMRLQTDGTGLGLFIVKNVVKEHGGEIKLKSKEGEGTEIVFTLPIHNTIK